MAHHYFQEDQEGRKKLRAIIEGTPSPFGISGLGLGATGRYPEGKLNDNDKGEIAIAIGGQDGKVIIDFGGEIGWVGFTPDQARQVAESLSAKADAIEATRKPDDQ